MSTNHLDWSQRTQQWVEALNSVPADLMSPGRTFEVLNNAATLASIGHDDMAGTVLRAWNAAVSRRVTADAS